METQIGNRWPLVITCLVILQLVTSLAIAQDSALQSERLKIADAGVARTVGIYCNKEKYALFYGTGAVISSDGLIVTSTTVVPPGAENIQVVFAGPEIRDAKIVEVNEALEATLIKVEATGLPFFPLARELPEIGQPNYTFGNAFNLIRLSGRAACSRGIISGIYQAENLGGESLYAGTAIETTAAINPGSDGGPIVNHRGQLSGIISLNVSPLRWQGIGVPSGKLIEGMKTLQEEKTVSTLRYEPLPNIIAESPEGLVAQGKHLADFIAGISVQRKYAPEVLPRVAWTTHQMTVKEWDKKSEDDKAKFHGGYFEAARLLEANQILRRPAQPATGLVISADGFILTSSFNVGDDVAFKDKKTGKIPLVEFKGEMSKLISDPKELVEENNVVEKIFVVLRDGRRHEAKLLSRNLQLGIALLKIEATGLAHLDLQQTATAPQLGARIGLLGFIGGDVAPYTLNVGIMGATERNNGKLCQTDALLNYGNTGGPAFDSDGKFIGIAGAPITPRTILGRVFTDDDMSKWTSAPNSGVGLIARADAIVAVLDDLKAGKSLLRQTGAAIGVAVDPERMFSDKVIIGGVEPGSAADKAGITKGDRIVSVGGEPISAWRQLTEQITRRKPGDKIEVQIERKDIGSHLLIKDAKVATQAELQELMKTMKPGEKFDGTFVTSDIKTVTVTLGERK